MSAQPNYISNSILVLFATQVVISLLFVLCFLHILLHQTEEVMMSVKRWIDGTSSFKFQVSSFDLRQSVLGNGQYSPAKQY